MYILIYIYKHIYIYIHIYIYRVAMFDVGIVDDSPPLKDLAIMSIYQVSFLTYIRDYMYVCVYIYIYICIDIYIYIYM